ELIGANPFSSEAGIASILVRTEGRPNGAVYALCMARAGEQVHFLSDALPISGSDAESFEIRATTDGSDPETGPIHRAGPAIDAGRVRAALFVDGHRVVESDSDTPKFRIAGSSAPE
ncbi:MAG: hypothetical protein KAJ43_11845, partial [Gemmatimonadetes bacterium]|nr:hypothetical protein [Gemmatimonadota bacterium]